ncbi:MAG: hypothetical protein KF770_29575, partial [Anaerolineae bacterium]|nr:hypothetical protein [Anaerolineae bacterium]
IPNMSIDDFYLGGYIQCDNLPLNCSFEQMFAHWTVEAPHPQDENWLPTTSEYHSGWYSAMAEVNSYAPEVPYLISSSIPVQPVGVEYRFSFYGKASDTATGIRVGGYVYWYNNDQLLGQMLIGIVEPYGHTDWTLFATPFTCAWPGANRAVMFFEVGDNSFVQGRRDFPARMFIDDVKAESRPVANCPLLNSGGN